VDLSHRDTFHASSSAAGRLFGDRSWVSHVGRLGSCVVGLECAMWLKSRRRTDPFQLSSGHKDGREFFIIYRVAPVSMPRVVNGISSIAGRKSDGDIDRPHLSVVTHVYAVWRKYERVSCGLCARAAFSSFSRPTVSLSVPFPILHEKEVVFPLFMTFASPGPCSHWVGLSGGFELAFEPHRLWAGTEAGRKRGSLVVVVVIRQSRLHCCPQGD
jgi:hypothetical protein